MQEAKHILLLSRNYRDYTASNLSELVRIKSLSCGEKEVAGKLAEQMKAARFDEVTIDGLGNVIGRVGRGKRIIAFDGHIDTVEVGNAANWNFDPFCGDIRDGYVHGRGAADQKGGVASMVTAGRILKESGFDRDLTVYFVGSVMEEDCDGLCWKYIIEEDGIRPELVVSTEPTDGGLYRGQRGRMEIEVEFKGVSSHGSAPERGKNAIYMASRACLAIEQLNEHLPVDDFLGKGSVALSQFVSGSPSLCAVADYARIHLDRRLTWGETKESAVRAIESLVQAEDAKVFVLNYEETAYTGKRYGMEKYYPTWKWPEDHAAVKAGARAYETLSGKPPRIGKWTFSTNAVTISGVYGIPAVGFGPGQEAMAHAPNEKTPIEDLVNAAAFYALYAFIA
jgi:putative selenium metabolism hydrolase